MAIAPVNKFINIAVPVTVGKQKLYEVPTGTSALLLYLQVANVGIAQTFPTVTFTQQRTQRSTGNKREVRVIKDVEIPPNDAAIIVDGRLVLEKTPLVLDKIFIEGTQQQTGIVTFVEYHEPTGIATIVTKDVHPFKPGDPITLAGLAFTCIAGQTGITTNIFPDPMQSYSVEDIEGVVGASKTFSMFIGKSTPLGITGKDYSHFYNSAIHYYERSKRLAIEVSTTSGSQTGYTSKTATAGTQATATAAGSNISGGALQGNLTITNGGAGYITNPTITFSDGGGGTGGSATITSASSYNSGVTSVAAGSPATLRWTISNGTCTASTDDVVLTNEALPTATAGSALSDICEKIPKEKLLGIVLACVSPENFEKNLDEIKKLGIPFGFKLNAFIRTNPKPNYTGAYKKSKTGNPNEFLGVREDLTPERMCDFVKKFKEAGATILGGCCETRPAHIKEMSKLI